MSLWIVLLAAVTGYLMGSISFARIIYRLVAPGEELTGMELDIAGSDEKVRVSAVSGTAVSVKLGGKWGGITALLDILKALVPTLAFRFLYPGMPYHLVAATTAMAGHNWPLYHGFKGGRGLSPLIGGFLGVDWLGTLVTNILGMAFSLLVLRSVLLSYMLGTWLMVPWLWFRTRDVYYVIYAIAANVLFVVAMIPDFRGMIDRKRRGIESDLAGTMEMTPMGRGIQKMASKMGLFKKNEGQDT
jgi:glycerol-3-phosphate acyltransferase PlsY